MNFIFGAGVTSALFAHGPIDRKNPILRSHTFISANALSSSTVFTVEKRASRGASLTCAHCKDSKSRCVDVCVECMYFLWLPARYPAVCQKCQSERHGKEYLELVSRKKGEIAADNASDGPGGGILVGDAGRGGRRNRGGSRGGRGGRGGRYGGRAHYGGLGSVDYDDGESIEGNHESAAFDGDRTACGGDVSRGRGGGRASSRARGGGGGIAFITGNYISQVKPATNSNSNAQNNFQGICAKQHQIMKSRQLQGGKCNPAIPTHQIAYTYIAFITGNYISQVKPARNRNNNELLQNVTPCYKMLQGVTKCNKVLQFVTQNCKTHITYSVRCTMRKQKQIIDMIDLAS